MPSAAENFNDFNDLATAQNFSQARKTFPEQFRALSSGAAKNVAHMQQLCQVPSARNHSAFNFGPALAFDSVDARRFHSPLELPHSQASGMATKQPGQG